jgi:hypothetical protein
LWLCNSIAQLEELNKNSGSLQDMVDNMDTVQSMTSVRDGMDNDVEQIASMSLLRASVITSRVVVTRCCFCHSLSIHRQIDKNLARRTEIGKAEADLVAMRKQLADRQAVLATLAARQQAVLLRYSPAAIIAALDITIENVCP